MSVSANRLPAGRQAETDRPAGAAPQPASGATPDDRRERRCYERSADYQSATRQTTSLRPRNAFRRYPSGSSGGL